MKRAVGLLPFVVLLAFIVGSLSFAQRGRGMNRMYNPKTVETITGTVLSVDEISLMQGRYKGVELKVKTEKDTTDVHLGPSSYIEQQKTNIGKGDTIQVTGSRVAVQGKQVLIAAEVKKGDLTLKLRDDQGVPVWGGRRRNR